MNMIWEFLDLMCGKKIEFFLSLKIQLNCKKLFWKEKSVG